MTPFFNPYCSQMPPETKTHTKATLGIAGLKGGSGKTLISVALARLWTKGGFLVGPFKKGPDYIDLEWLSLASRAPCYCLDAYLMTGGTLKKIFTTSHQKADILLIEGNRGVFDGLDSKGSYSFAKIAKILNIPIILVIDCTKMTATAAALVKGVQAIDPNLRIAGVILNQLSGSRHERVTSEAIQYFTKLPILGTIPRLQDIKFLERPLGLIPPQELSNSQEILDAFATRLAPHLKLEEIFRIAQKPDHRVSVSDCIENLPPSSTNTTKIGIIRDRAFHFYYEENLSLFRAKGASLIFLDALRDKSLPQGIQGLYIGGGFPERFAKDLAKNLAFKNSLKQAILEGLPVYAECGGLLYLSESLTLNVQEFPMVGVFPFRFCLEPTPQAHGYTAFRPVIKNPYYRLNSVVRGHEFRYARLQNPEILDNTPLLFQMERGKGLGKGKDGVMFRNTLGSFQHTHAASMNVSWIGSLIKMSNKFQLRS